MKQTFIDIGENSEIISKAALRQLFSGHAPGKYKVRIERADKRSLNQNDYFHGPVLEIVKDALRDAGWEHIRNEMDAKRWLKSKFLKVAVMNHETGEMMEEVRDTSDLSIEEFGRFLEDIGQFLSEELGVYLPPPCTQRPLFKVA